MMRYFSTLNLVRWYQKAKRDLPWRRNPTPYFVWVSEIMLQQTQVQSVLPYYERFLKRFPTLKTLAQAPESEVLARWSGLGYYSRARNLHKAAKIVQEKYKGEIPQTKEEILELPGIGPYTAGAILSIAYHQAMPLLDGNVKRILSRFFLETSESVLWNLAEELVLDAHSKKIDPSDHNQAMMELGALVCLPENPLCTECPLQESCSAKKKNSVHLYPPKKKKNKTIHQSYALFVISNGEKKFLLHKRSEKERWFKNMWEFPMILVKSINKTKELREEFLKKTGYSIRVDRSYPYFSHSITHHRLKIWPLQCTLLSQSKKRKKDGYSWLERDKIKELSSSSILSKTLALLQGDLV